MNDLNFLCNGIHLDKTVKRTSNFSVDGFFLSQIILFEAL